MWRLDYVIRTAVDCDGGGLPVIRAHECFGHIEPVVNRYFPTINPARAPSDRCVCPYPAITQLSRYSIVPERTGAPRSHGRMPQTSGTSFPSAERIFARNGSSAFDRSRAVRCKARQKNRFRTFRLRPRQTPRPAWSLECRPYRSGPPLDKTERSANQTRYLQSKRLGIRRHTRPKSSSSPEKPKAFVSFDHLVGPGEEEGRDVETEGAGRIQVDDKLIP